MNKNTKVRKTSTGARGTVNRHLVAAKCWCRRIETNRARRLPFFPMHLQKKLRRPHIRWCCRGLSQNTTLLGILDFRQLWTARRGKFSDLSARL